jgi:hypothetical protein
MVFSQDDIIFKAPKKEPTADMGKVKEKTDEELAQSTGSTADDLLRDLNNNS